MMRFYDLPRVEIDAKCSPTNLGEADRAFPTLVAKSHLHLARPDEPIPAKGLRILLGIATWSEYDLRLLDVVNDALSESNRPHMTVDVFNIGGLQSGDFEKLIPGLGPIYQTPIVGIWRDGVLIEKGAGFEGRELATRMFGSNSNEIVEFVTRQRPSATSPASAS